MYFLEKLAEVDLKTAGGERIIKKYFEKCIKSPPPKTCDFDTILADLRGQFPRDFKEFPTVENTRTQRELFWEEHKTFKPKNWEIIPLKLSYAKSGERTYSYMEFTFEKELHWEDRILDPIFEPTQKQDDGADKVKTSNETVKTSNETVKTSNEKVKTSNEVKTSNDPVVCLLAATACGKTSTIFRALSKHHGFYFCCDANISVFENNRSTRDYLMVGFHDTLKNLSQNEIIAFGVNISHLVYISRLFSLYLYCTDCNWQISPIQFLKLQINGGTTASRKIFKWLVSQKYHHFTSEELELVLQNLLDQFRDNFNLPVSHKFSIFIDEAQSFCSTDNDDNKKDLINEKEKKEKKEKQLLNGKYTCTANNTPRQNDLFSLLLATFSKINDNCFFVTGTAFSSDIINLINSSACKQDEDIKIIVGQSLIETKEDLVKKLKSIMNVTKELAEFIDTSIHKYLPIRRRVFTRACSNILLYNENTAESFKNAFDDSFSKAKDKIAKHFPELLARNKYQDNVAKTLLKYLSMFDVSVFDHTCLGALLPQHLENFTNILIASGIAPYYTMLVHKMPIILRTFTSYLKNLFVWKLQKSIVKMCQLL